MKPKSHWTPRNWLAFPLLIVSLAWFVAYADDPKPEKESSDSQPALESPAEPQETVTDTSTAPDKKETKEQPAQPTDPNLNKPSTETTFPGNAFGGGFGGGGYGGGGGGFGGGGVGGGQAAPPKYLIRGDVSLFWNKEKTVYWGHSNLLDKWASVQIPENSGDAIPLLHSYIACLQVKDRIYSFSAKLGKWTSVDLPKDSGKVIPMLTSNVAFFRLKDRVYGFSASVGQWEELKVNAPADPALFPDSIFVMDGDKLHIFSEKTGRWASPGEDESKSLKIQFHNFPSLVPVTTSTSPAPVTIPGPSVLYATQSGLTQQQAHVAATAVLTQPQNLWRRRADLYQQSAKELLVAVQRIDQQSPDASETRERMKKEYDELLQLTVDARLNAQKEDAQLLKTRLEKIEAQIAENEKKKAEMVQQLDEQFKTAPTPRRPTLEDNSESSPFDRRVNPPSSRTARPTEFIP